MADCEFLDDEEFAERPLLPNVPAASESIEGK